jgi:hypothetical protein
MNLTLRQAAILIVRFFGFYLLFYAVLGIADFPGYWIRSTYSHTGSFAHTSLDTSFDITFLMYLLRQAIHIIAGMYFVGQPRKLADWLIKTIDGK